MKEKLKNKLLGINEISDNKQKPIIFLLIWLIFIGAVVVLVRNNTNNVDNSNQNVVAFNSLETIFDRYKTYKYEISISDLDNNSKIVFASKRFLNLSIEISFSERFIATNTFDSDFLK